jgi:hypothetical protein
MRVRDSAEGSSKSGKFCQQEKFWRPVTIRGFSCDIRLTDGMILLEVLQDFLNRYHGNLEVLHGDLAVEVPG